MPGNHVVAKIRIAWNERVVAERRLLVLEWMVVFGGAERTKYPTESL